MKIIYKSINTNKLKLEEEHNKQIFYNQQENARLINECYEWREEKESLNRRVSDLDADIKEFGIQWKVELCLILLWRSLTLNMSLFKKYEKNGLTTWG